MFPHLMQDLRFAVRQVRRHPAFAAIAVASLALGIGANTAIFSVVRAVLLMPPSYRDPARVVRISQSLPALGEGNLGTSPGEYLDYRDRTRAFAAVAGYRRATFSVTDLAEAERIDAVRASASLFPTLGVEPMLGRAFTTAEETPGADRVAVLGFDYWTRRFGQRADVLGQTLTLDEQRYTVIGVMPAGFEFPVGHASVEPPPALWVPLTTVAGQDAMRATSFDTGVVARLGDGLTLSQAEQDVARVADEFQRAYPQVYAGSIKLRTSVAPIQAATVAAARPVLALLAAAVICVLLTACANVATLLLVRASAREREIAVRRALGASHGRIVRQLLTESLLLGGLGGVLGCLLATALMRVAGSVAPGQIFSLRGVAIDATMLAFALMLSMLTGVLCGLAPALGFRTHATGEALKRAGRQIGAGRDRSRLRNILVMAEAAAAVVLLVGAGLLVHSFVEVLSVSRGFDPTGVLVVKTTFNRERYPDGDKRRQAQQAIADRLAALPGVTRVGVSTHIPLADDRTIGFALERDGPQKSHWAANALVSGDYFAAMGIPLVRGRTFERTDEPNTPLVAIVNQTLVRRYLAGREPIGERILWGGRTLTIVGVAGDVRIKALDADVEPTVYCSVYQVESGATTSGTFVMRTTDATPASWAAAARAAVRSVDPGIPVFDVRAMDQIVARSLASRRFMVTLLGGFAGAALLLATIGLYAVLSHVVAQRTPEVGVRLALGARPAEILRLVMREGMRLVIAGLVVGIVGAIVLARAMTTFLFQVGHVDPLAFIAAAMLLILVSLVATYVPARRAARVDPLTALRSE